MGLVGVVAPNRYRWASRLNRNGGNIIKEAWLCDLENAIHFDAVAFDGHYGAYLAHFCDPLTPRLALHSRLPQTAL